jgi:hypothetical protein
MLLPDESQEGLQTISMFGRESKSEERNIGIVKKKQSHTFDHHDSQGGGD